ncbi:hypothetical protein BJ875DRAFT_37963 [Amylocarpus encephaloides]|uniref:Uncharacterized protein n=1 Tax=Amylocarpus encephaloides TaxID=45428 RepID=A0A9P7YH08_9HELO|nr:hypothetical protein BJ875DRAFT_37963 [Amylocarpus encephaloides]
MSSFPSFTHVPPTLTTSFEPASSCSTRLHSVASYAAWFDGSDPQFTSCNPPEWDRKFDRSQVLFSPGVCPSGYRTVESGSSGLTSYASCCMSGYTKRSDQCKSAMSVGQPVVVLSGSSSVSTTTLDPTANAWHYAFVVMWQSSDLSLFSEATRTTSLSISTVVVPTVIYVPVSSDGLSSGAKIGIGISAGAAAVLLATCVFLWLFVLPRRRKQRPEQSEVVVNHGIPELDSSGAVFSGSAGPPKMTSLGQKWQAISPVSPTREVDSKAAAPAYSTELDVQPVSGESELRRLELEEARIAERRRTLLANAGK